MTFSMARGHPSDAQTTRGSSPGRGAGENKRARRGARSAQARRSSLPFFSRGAGEGATRPRLRGRTKTTVVIAPSRPPTYCGRGDGVYAPLVVQKHESTAPRQSTPDRSLPTLISTFAKPRVFEPAPDLLVSPAPRLPSVGGGYNSAPEPVGVFLGSALHRLVSSNQTYLPSVLSGLFSPCYSSRHHPPRVDNFFNMLATAGRDNRSQFSKVFIPVIRVVDVSS